MYVKSLKKIIKEEKLQKFWEHVKEYFVEEILDKWTLLTKISAFNSTNNYIEQEFGNILPKKKEENNETYKISFIIIPKISKYLD